MKQEKQAQIVAAIAEMSEDEIDELIGYIADIKAFYAPAPHCEPSAVVLPDVIGTLEPPVTRPEFDFEED